MISSSKKFSRNRPRRSLLSDQAVRHWFSNGLPHQPRPRERRGCVRLRADQRLAPIAALRAQPRWKESGPKRPRYRRRPAHPGERRRLRMIVLLRSLALTFALAGAAGALAAEDPPASAPAANPQQRPAKPADDQKPADLLKPRPADSTTEHKLDLSGRSLNIKATVSVIHLTDDKGAPAADVVTTAYQLKDADARTRPVTFVFNGGPGGRSALAGA